jgi:hypothetical protein
VHRHTHASHGAAGNKTVPSRKTVIVHTKRTEPPYSSFAFRRVQPRGTPRDTNHTDFVPWATGRPRDKSNRDFALGPQRANEQGAKAPRCPSTWTREQGAEVPLCPSAWAHERGATVPLCLTARPRGNGATAPYLPSSVDPGAGVSKGNPLLPRKAPQTRRTV